MANIQFDMTIEINQASIKIMVSSLNPLLYSVDNLRVDASYTAHVLAHSRGREIEKELPTKLDKNRNLYILEYELM